MIVRRAERQHTKTAVLHRAPPGFGTLEKKIDFLVRATEALLHRTSPMAQAQARAEQQEIARKFYNTYQ